MTEYEPSPRISGEPPNRCWFRIGVWGSGTCEDLKHFVHCFNCPVYQSAGKNLFDRPPSSEYTSRMTDALKNPFEPPGVSQGSFLVFFLQGERFALSAECIRAVTPFSSIHSVPFRSDSLFLGLSPVRGKLRLCYSLSAALGGEDSFASNTDFRRMLLMGPPHVSFVFPVSEVEGLIAISEESMDLRMPSDEPSIVLGTASIEGGDVCVLDRAYIENYFSNKQL